jgi:hypothetical protein
MEAGKTVVGLALVAAVFCAGAAADLQSAKRKALLIETDRVPAHGSVAFTVAEVNAYAAEEARKEVPDGLRSPKIVLRNGMATGTALIDFAKVQTARGGAPNLLLGMLLRGERPVTVELAVQSGDGTARVDLRSVTVGGATLSGRPLEMVIEYYVLPRYPDAAIGRPFQLRHNIKKIGLSSAGVKFLFGAAPPPATPPAPAATKK